jgi:monofunctional glycosyltransferase
MAPKQLLTYFGKPASALTLAESTLIAASLPNPRKWSPAQPDGYLAARSQVIGRLVRIARQPDGGLR